MIAVSLNWKKMPSPRISEAGTHFGATRDSGARRSLGTSKRRVVIAGRLNPREADQRPDFTHAFHQHDLFEEMAVDLPGGDTCRSLKLSVVLLAAGLEKTFHSGVFRSAGSPSHSRPSRLAFSGSGLQNLGVVVGSKVPQVSAVPHIFTSRSLLDDLQDRPADLRPVAARLSGAVGTERAVSSPGISYRGSLHMAVTWAMSQLFGSNPGRWGRRPRQVAG